MASIHIHGPQDLSATEIVDRLNAIGFRQVAEELDLRVRWTATLDDYKRSPSEAIAEERRGHD